MDYLVWVTINTKKALKILWIRFVIMALTKNQPQKIMLIDLNLQNRVQIKCIAIAKCDLFFHYCNAKEISFYYFCDTKLCTEHTHTKKNIREFHLYCWDHVCKVNGWCLVDCFHCGFKVSIQLMVRDYCIAKCKKFSTCSRLVMALWAIFFAIHNNNKLQHKCSFLETHFAMQVTIQKLLYHYLY